MTGGAGMTGVAVVGIASRGRSTHPTGFAEYHVRMEHFDPMVAMADARHEFGEHGGVNMSIEASTTFTVMQAGLMPQIFSGRLGPEQGGCYLYGRHFNCSVSVGAGISPIR